MPKRTHRKSYRTGDKPRAVSEVLEQTLGAYRLKAKLKEYSAFPNWREIVGEEIAAVAEPEKILRGKVLVVRVKDAAWAQELSMRKSEIIQRWDDFGSGALIEDIRFVTGGVESP